MMTGNLLVGRNVFSMFCISRDVILQTTKQNRINLHAHIKSANCNGSASAIASVVMSSYNATPERCLRHLSNALVWDMCEQKRAQRCRLQTEAF